MHNNDSIGNSPNQMTSPLNEDFSSEYKLAPLKKYKLRVKYFLTLIIFLLTLLGIILNYHFIINISPTASEVGQNLSNLTIKCKNKTLLSKSSIKRYNSSISKYSIMKTTNFVIQIISSVTGFFSVIVFYIIIRKKKNLGIIPKMLKSTLFWLMLTIGVFKYGIILLYLAMFAKFVIILNFLKSNTEKEFISINFYREVYNFLQRKKKYFLILALFYIGGLIVIIYYLKLLLVFNHFFVFPSTPIETKTEDDSVLENEMVFLPSDSLKQNEETNNINESNNNENINNTNNK